MKSTFCLALCFFGALVYGGEEEARLAAFSAFGKIGPRQLLQLADHGEVMTSANTSMNFARGISTQACYFIAQPPAAVAALLQNWNPSQHPEMEVYQYRTFHNAADAHFDALKLDSKIEPVRRLLAAMAQPSELQLSRPEVATVAGAAHADAAPRFWSQALQMRWSALQNGGAASLPAYVTAGGEFSTAAESKSLLAEEPRIVGHFDQLLQESSLFKKAAAAPTFYWSVSKVDKMAAVDLGAIYAKNLGDRWQVLDVDFYVSSGYFTSIVFYELLPITLSLKQGTLVWQCDLVSAPGLAGGFGIKRKIASVLIQNDVKSSVRALQRAAAR